MREGGDVELECNGQDVLVFPSLPPSLQVVYGTILPFNNIASSLLQVRGRREGGREGGWDRT